ncbi:MAG: galactokinase, partial [Lachnospiraceae bacterium]|nr:galactokinase [Galactobacillus timonensis]MDY5222928.1 galactokinase [Lachnospiraceae bacterium]
KMPAEMKAVAKVLGHEVLSQCSLADLIANAKTIREQCGDRAFLRAFHFFHETERAKKEKEALAAKDTDRFLQLVIESGESSFMFLQNVYPPNDSKHESLAVGLALSQELLKGKGGAWRVHGGGFAGTIQAFVPNSLVEIYKATMEHTFGEGCCYVLRIRDCGGVKVA